MIVQGNSVDFGYARLCSCAFMVRQSACRSHAESLDLYFKALLLRCLKRLGDCSSKTVGSMMDRVGEDLLIETVLCVVPKHPDKVR